jgi:aspartate kinase
MLQVFGVLDEMNVNVKMISQGASKTNISLIVSNESAKTAVQSIHAMFFGVHNVCAASDVALNKDKPVNE